MFPASYLIPSTVKFMTSRKPENRLQRTREHGFLLLVAVWIIGFFSISESKLPTYILPAFPFVCLLMGSMLEKKIFSIAASDTAMTPTDPTGTSKPRRTWLEKTGRRAPFELAFWFLVTSISIITIFETATPYARTLIGCTVLLLSLAIVAGYTSNHPNVSWACFGVTAVFMMSLTAHHLVPAISQGRSIHFAAGQLQTTPELSDLPVVFFGRESYGAQLNLEPKRIKHFEETDVRSVVEFLNQNPNAIIIASKDPMEVLRRDLAWTIELEKCEQARHLYISRPNPRVARQTDTTFR